MPPSRLLPLLLLHLLPPCTPQTATTTLVTTLAGSGAYSQSAIVDGTGTAALLYFPRSTCSFDGINLYVADRSNYAIRLVNTATGATSTFVGSRASGAADGVGTSAQFNWPNACCFDAAGATMFVLEFSGHRVRAVALATRTVTTLAGGGAGGGRTGYAEGLGTNALFNSPWGIAFRNGVVYVADTSNNVIRNISAATGAVGTFIGNASFPVAGSLDSPRGVAVSPGGFMYICDTGNNRVRSYKMDLSGGVNTFAGFNDFNGIADGPSARFSDPYGVTVANSLIYITDSANCAIRVITPSGTASTLAGGTCPRSTSESQGLPDGPAWVQTNLGSVSGAVSVLASGAVAVADFSQHRVRLITRQLCPAGSFCTGAFGQPWPCPVNAFCPAGSSAPTPCPRNGTTLYAGAAASGACVTPLAASATFACNATASVAAGALLPSQLIALPNVTDAAPLVVLSAAAPANAFGVDIVVATPAACAAYANAPGSPTCTSQSFPIGLATYFFLGAADALGMVAAPACAA